MHIDKYNEDHLVTMPKVHVEGLVTGCPSPELSGTSYIHSSSGYTAKIEYSSKGWLSGKRNAFIATIFLDDHENEPIYIAEGQWSDTYIIKNANSREIIEKINLNDLKRTPLIVPPIEKQHRLESRRAWQHVVSGINRGDIFAVGHEKSKIENEQRQMRKREKCEGREFRRRYFTQAKEDPVAEKLAEGLKGSLVKIDVDGQRMIWLWDEEKYRRVEEDKRNGIKSPVHTRFDSGIEGIDIVGA